MGALENMQEEIIPLVPVLMLLGRGLGVDAITVVAMSAGAAMIGSAFGPTNPFQAGIAMKLAQLSPMSGGGTRLAMLFAGFVLWVAWTMRHAIRTRRLGSGEPRNPGTPEPQNLRTSDVLIFGLIVSPILAYVYGAVALGWGFNELSAGFVIAGIAAGLIGRLGMQGTVEFRPTQAEGLLAPYGAVHRRGPGDFVAFVPTDKAFREEKEVPIGVGLSDGMHVIVTSGLKAGDKVYVKRPTRFGREDKDVE